MKKTPLKRKTRLKQVSSFKPKRKIGAKKALHKPKLPKTKTLENKLWELCKKLTRKLYPNNCYTCPATALVGCNCQTGHGKPKGALTMKFKYDLRNLRNQCMRCNLHYGGVTDIFIAKLEREKEGLQFLQEACVKIDGKWEIKRDSNSILGGTEAKLFLMQKIKEYQDLLDRL